jgi:putative solute:sodium symporter small subunit
MPVNSPYWKKTRRLTVLLLLVWVFNWYAADLNQYSFLGFPLGFYMAAQGEMLIFLGIIWFYNRAMDRLDAENPVRE